MTTDIYSSPLLWNIVYSIGVIILALAAVAGINRSFEAMSHRFKSPAFRSRILRRVVGYTLLIISILIALNRFGFDTQAILAVAGTILGIFAIGFVAVWSVLSNFLCTLIIVALKPFHPGDEVSIPGENVDGVVEEISLTFTLLKRPDGSIVSVPNNIFFQKTFIKKPRQSAA